ncbi:unnamed protein product [Durusdinium trenchii]|uniref:Peptidylprolyl isomerase n=1 Tax=Durusdinium trenchii TaxID=1381693 RepID=A0ABP0KDY5_9DINO
MRRLPYNKVLRQAPFHSVGVLSAGVTREEIFVKHRDRHCAHSALLWQPAAGELRLGKLAAPVALHRSTWGKVVQRRRLTLAAGCCRAWTKMWMSTSLDERLPMPGCRPVKPCTSLLHWRQNDSKEAAHGEELDAPNVTLDLQQEGTIIRLIVGGQTILNGRLAHQIKPGEQIWMVEEASDGKDFVVCELDKLTPGVNWASVMEPEVEAVADYARAVVEMPEILTEEEERLVDETLHHLQRTHRTLRPVEGRAASIGDVVTVDMQGYELQPDGSRGNPLEIGSATGLDIELGSGAFSRQVEANLEGIQVGESRDVQVTLGQRAGGLGGSSIICAVTCQALQEQQLPELSDEFAKVVKRQDLFKQAGTAEGIPEEEEGVAESFTMADLRAEIVQEVRQAAQTQVRCHWAELGSQEAVLEEELFVRVRFVAEREGLMSYIDMDAVDRQAWDKLGEPDDGESLKQVGKDPAREYQDAHTVVFREHLMNEVLHWLRQQMEIVVEEGQ